MKSKLVVLFRVLLLPIIFSSAVAGETGPHPSQRWADANPGWVESVEPFQIAGPVYFVGTRGLGIFLIATDDGHILIDGGMPGYEAQILASIRTLGFDPDDVKILLNTHAHFDHSGGLAELKRRTGAKMIASARDKPALEGGFYPGFENNPSVGAPPIKVDEVIADGETISLGGVVLTAALTPGHSPGCTSWWLHEQVGEGESVLIFGSATVAANSLIRPEQHEGIVEDYRYTFEKTKDWQPDIFLANHPGFSNLFSERLRAEAGEPDAWRNEALFRRMMTRLEEAFEQELEQQTLEARE